MWTGWNKNWDRSGYSLGHDDASKQWSEFSLLLQVILFVFDVARGEAWVAESGRIKRLVEVKRTIQTVVSVAPSGPNVCWHCNERTECLVALDRTGQPFGGIDSNGQNFW